MRHGLYIHIPYCVQKCPYCNFFSVTDTSYLSEYLNALLTEIKSLAGVSFDTVYVGGGTPSVLGSELPVFLEKAMSLIGYFGTEFTVEVNPETVSASLMKGLAHLPVSRISMGAQSTDDSVLKLLRRIHSAKQVFTAYDIIRNNIECAVNLDLMYDIPLIDARIIRGVVEKLSDLQPEHISAYSYSPDTGYLTNKTSAVPYQTEMVAGLLQNKGYRQYEVSNFAVLGYESRHNMKYWNMSPYYGIGAGAHSMIIADGKRLRYCHLPDIKRYIANPIERDNIEVYDCETAVLESVVFGLRQIEGIELLEIREKFGIMPTGLMDKINSLADRGLLECIGDRVKVSRKGLLLLDSVMSYLW